MVVMFFDQLVGDIWYDGIFVFWFDVKLYVLSYGFYYGSSVFEGEWVYGGWIFKFEEYMEWLFVFVGEFGFSIFWIVEQINVVKEEMFQWMNFVDVYICLVVWCGSEMMGILV